MFIFLFTRMTTWLQMCARDSRHARNASPTHFFISILFLDPFLLSVFLFLFCFLLLRIDDAQWGIRTDCIQIWSVEPNFVIRKKTPPSIKSKLPHIYGKFRSNILKRKREKEKMQMLEKKMESSQLSKFVHFQRGREGSDVFDETGFTALPAGREQRVPLQSRHAVRKGPRDEDEWWQCATVHRIDHQLVANRTKGNRRPTLKKI